MTDLCLREETDPGCPSGLAVSEAAPPGAFDPGAFVRREGGLNRLELLVRGARCAGCLAKIEKSLLAMPGVEEARLNLTTGQLRLAWRGQLPAAELSARLIARSTLERLRTAREPLQLDLCITHDTTLWLLKDRLLEQPVTEVDSEFLDAIVLYELGDGVWLQSRHGPARNIAPALAEL